MYKNNHKIKNKTNIYIYILIKYNTVDIQGSFDDLLTLYCLKPVKQIQE